MHDKNNGGPAFPAGLASGHIEPLHPGMTLRDYFAAHATTDDVAAQINMLRLRYEMGVLPDDYTAICRYMHADAMLLVRNQS